MLNTIKKIKKYNELEYNCWSFAVFIYSFTADYGLYILPELKYHNVNFAIDTNAS